MKSLLHSATAFVVSLAAAGSSVNAEAATPAVATTNYSPIQAPVSRGGLEAEFLADKSYTIRRKFIAALGEHTHMGFTIGGGWDAQRNLLGAVGATVGADTHVTDRFALGIESGLEAQVVYDNAFLTRVAARAALLGKFTLPNNVTLCAGPVITETDGHDVQFGATFGAEVPL